MVFALEFQPVGVALKGVQVPFFQYPETLYEPLSQKPHAYTSLPVTTMEFTLLELPATKGVRGTQVPFFQYPATSTPAELE